MLVEALLFWTLLAGFIVNNSDWEDEFLKNEDQSSRLGVLNFFDVWSNLSKSCLC
jgi:hypothetical protein